MEGRSKMGKIQNYQYTIQQAFRECFYIVPDYQREYVWKDKEVVQLLDDIDEQMADGSRSEYFIGTVLVSPSKEKEHFEVIDGQQRLTTLFLLLCALRKAFSGEMQRKMLDDLIATNFVDEDGDIQSSLKLTPRYENAEEVMKALVNLNPEPAEIRASLRVAGIKAFGSFEHLIQAYSTIYKYRTDNYDTEDRLKKRRASSYLSHESRDK
jgi:hypothetical protein